MTEETAVRIAEALERVGNVTYGMLSSMWFLAGALFLVVIVLFLGRND